MGLRLLDVFANTRGELRYQPTEKRIRAMLGDQTAADSDAAMLVWEPRRVVPSYAVAVEHVHGELVPAATKAQEDPGAADAPLLHTAYAFAVHSTAGEELGIRVGDETREGAAFRPSDPDLAGYVVLDFHAFDAWYEEEEPIVSHPRDPFHRVDILSSTRRVRIELEDELLAESSRTYMVFETGMPVRFYIPPEDVRVELRPNDKRTYCAYKGEASYRSLDVAGSERDDLVWGYVQPLRQAAELAGRVAFFDEKVDVILDGRRREKPRTALSASIVEEADL